MLVARSKEEGTWGGRGRAGSPGASRRKNPRGRGPGVPGCSRPARAQAGARPGGSASRNEVDVPVGEIVEGGGQVEGLAGADVGGEGTVRVAIVRVPVPPDLDPVNEKGEARLIAPDPEAVR